MSSTVIIGGTGGLGTSIAKRHAARGDTVVITGREAQKAAEVAREIGGDTRGLAVDLARPETIAEALAEVDAVDHLILAAFEGKPNSVKEFDITGAVRAATIKLVGYTEVVHVLRPRFRPGASVVIFGGLAMNRPYPGSTMVTAVNGAVASLVKTLAAELAPHRVNGLHPAIVGDSPRWSHMPNHPSLARTPIGRLVTMDEIGDALDFLLRNGGVNAQNLFIDGGLQVS